jgi:hypothetical protein
MKELNIIELYLLKGRIIKEGMSDDILMDEVLEAIEYREQLILETSATGGAVTGGAGAVVSAQPSGLAGSTIGPNWSNNGGTTGSGDVSVPYNSGSAKDNMIQKVQMGKNHGARTGKKSRKKKLDMKTLKNIFANRPDFSKDGEKKKPGEKKVMDFNDFAKSDINKVKK